MRRPQHSKATMQTDRSSTVGVSVISYDDTGGMYDHVVRPCTGWSHCIHSNGIMLIHPARGVNA